jgi:general secretion pathway protein G
MFRPNPRNRRRREAFTLIEVLLVLAILVILGSMTVFFLGGTSEQAKINAARTEIASLENSIGIFLTRFGDYPESLDQLYNVPPPRRPGDVTSPVIDNPVGKDPWGNEYLYQFPGNKKPHSFDLYSAGPDKQVGTSDDIGNWRVEQ